DVARMFGHNTRAPLELRHPDLTKCRCPELECLLLRGAPKPLSWPGAFTSTHRVGKPGEPGLTQLHQGDGFEHPSCGPRAVAQDREEKINLKNGAAPALTKTVPYKVSGFSFVVSDPGGSDIIEGSSCPKSRTSRPAAIGLSRACSSIRPAWLQNPAIV